MAREAAAVERPAEEFLKPLLEVFLPTEGGASCARRTAARTGTRERRGQVKTARGEEPLRAVVMVATKPRTPSAGGADVPIHEGSQSLACLLRACVDPRKILGGYAQGDRAVSRAVDLLARCL